MMLNAMTASTGGPGTSDQAKRGPGQRQAVGERERGNRRDDAVRAPHQQQQRQNEQQMVEPEQDMLDTEEGSRFASRQAGPVAREP